MTTEEKAKAYDRAVKQAEKEILTCGSLNCDAARQIFRLFPQLGESEDERTRKEIIEFIQNTIIKRGIKDANGTAVKWIAYLEKQKEQKPEELVYRLNGLMQEYYNAGESEEEKEHRFKCYQLFWDAMEDSEFFTHNPMEWSEEEKKFLQVAISCTYDRGYLSVSNWLKSLLSSWKSN